MPDVALSQLSEFEQAIVDRLGAARTREQLRRIIRPQFMVKPRAGQEFEDRHLLYAHSRSAAPPAHVVSLHHHIPTPSNDKRRKGNGVVPPGALNEAATI